MKLKYVAESVTYPVAKQRTIEYLTQFHRKRLIPAHWIAGAIWPNHNMRHQGAGGAASRILHRMLREGLVRWRSEFTTNGTWCGSGWELK